MKRAAKLTCFLLLMAVLMPAWAMSSAPKNKVTQSVPDSVFFMVYAQETEADDFIGEYWGRVWTDVQNAGVLDDLFGLMMGSVQDPDQRAMAQAKIDEVLEVISSVDWKSLGNGDVLFTMRYMEGKSIVVNGGNINVGPPEEVFILESDPEKVASNFDGLKGILEYISALNPEVLKLETEKTDTTEYAFINVSAGEQSIVKFGTARRGNLIAFGLHDTLLREILDNMEAGGAQSPLIATKRYQSAFKDLHSKGFSHTYFDMKQMADVLEGSIMPALQSAQGEVPEGEQKELQAVTAIAKLIFREFRVLDRTAEVGYIDGHKLMAESYAYLGEDAQDTLIYSVMGNTKPVENWSEYIPVEAVGFSVSAGTDLNALYQGIRAIVSENVPDGDQVLSQVDQQMQAVGFSIEGDLLSWITTESVSFSIPGMATGDGATIIRVKDSEKARTMINRAVGILDQLATQKTGQALMRMPATQVGEEFELVTHPAIAAFVRPVIGVKNDRLFIGSSERAISLSLQTAAGTHDSVLKNERFLKQGVHPKGAVTKMTFKDLSGVGQQVGQMFGMMGMAGAFIGAQPDAPKELQKVFSILQRLAPVAQRVDFLESSSSAVVLREDGWYGTRAMNYRAPTPSQPGQ